MFFKKKPKKKKAGRKKKNNFKPETFFEKALVKVIGDYWYQILYNDLLSDNVEVNYKLSPFIGVMICSIFYFQLGMPLGITFETLFSGALFNTGLFTLVYFFSSSYFQPDLDQYRNRPGMKHFPLGYWMLSEKNVGSFAKIGRFLKWLLFPIRETFSRRCSI